MGNSAAARYTDGLDLFASPNRRRFHVAARQQTPADVGRPAGLLRTHARRVATLLADAEARRGLAANASEAFDVADTAALAAVGSPEPPQEALALERLALAEAGVDRQDLGPGEAQRLRALSLAAAARPARTPAARRAQARRLLAAMAKPPAHF
jgi:hypothetical protein